MDVIGQFKDAYFPNINYGDSIYDWNDANFTAISFCIFSCITLLTSRKTREYDTFVSYLHSISAALLASWETYVLVEALYSGCTSDHAMYVCQMKEAGVASAAATAMFNPVVSSIGYRTRAWSLGYFFVDTFDVLIVKGVDRKNYTLAAHHFMIIVCLTFAILEQLYAPIQLIFLLVEYNSIFLHQRKMLRILGTTYLERNDISVKSIPLVGFLLNIVSYRAMYNVTMFFFYLTFAVFRIGVLFVLFIHFPMFYHLYATPLHLYLAIVGYSAIAFDNLCLIKVILRVESKEAEERLAKANESKAK
eukprot:Nk52_evm1s1515 gene=Nk52_evmTU1s1515